MPDRSSISGAQLRAARALLKWSVRELSDRCGVSRSAISRSEKVDGTLAMQLRNLNAIRRTFEDHGVEFLGRDGVLDHVRFWHKADIDKPLNRPPPRRLWCVRLARVLQDLRDWQCWPGECGRWWAWW